MTDPTPALPTSDRLGPRSARTAGGRSREEREALHAGIERLDRLAASLGDLDPLDVEPAAVWTPVDPDERRE